MTQLQPQRAVIDGIPLLWIAPQQRPEDVPCPLTIWLPPFAGSKESTEPQLHQLAEAGFVALSFDPYQHGESRIEAQDELIGRVVGNIRRYFWPILAESAQDTLRIIDWALNELRSDGEICIGGFSMGGDIAIAAAGLDLRISRVAACGATPDWLRPGSIEPPGQADSLAQFLYETCNPLTNLDRYRNYPAISFQCGAEDRQVPAEGARKFVEMAAPLYSHCLKRLDFCPHPNVGHAFTEEMWQNCLHWFTKPKLKELPSP